MARKLELKVKDPKTYEEYTGKKTKKGTVVKHSPEEAELLFKCGAVELTKLQQAILEKRKKKEQPKNTNISKEAEDLRKNPEFFELCVKEIQKKVVGEEHAIKTIGITATGRLVKNARKTSFNASANDESGLGKDHHTKNSLELFVPEDKLMHRTRITPAVLNYWHNPRFEPEWTWDNKVLYLEDVSDGILNSEVMKTFLSNGSKTTIVINQMAIDIEIKGKPVCFMTFANTIPNKEMLRRIHLYPVDPSDTQTHNIKVFNAINSSTGFIPEYEEKFKEVINSLQEKESIIPKEIALSIINYFPDTPISRTIQGRFFDWMKSSCVFHQYQRKTNEKGQLITEKQDYEIVRELFMYALFSSSAVPVSNTEKKVLKAMEKSDKQEFTIVELTEIINFISKRALYTTTNILTDKGLMKKELIDKDVSGGEYPVIREVEVFSLKEKQKFFLPRYKDLINPDSTSHTTHTTNSSHTTNTSLSKTTNKGILLNVDEVNEVNEAGFGGKKIKKGQNNLTGKVQCSVCDGFYSASEIDKGKCKVCREMEKADSRSGLSWQK